MRWFWFATFTLICCLLSVFFRQPLILIGELFLIDVFLTRKIKWFFWINISTKPVPGWLNLLVWLLVTIWIIRLLAIDSITIISPSSKASLQTGDNVLISKILYGPRLPVSIAGRELPYHRLSGIKGLSGIRRGDLLAFNFPEGDSVLSGMESISYYSLKRKKESDNDSLSKFEVQFHPVDRREPEIIRCIGLPGDTIVIQSSQDSSLFQENIAYDYLVEVKNRQLPIEFLNSLGLSPSEIQIMPGLGYLIPLRRDQVKSVKQRPEVASATPYLLEKERGDYNIFPHDARYLWNRDNFGPVIVPGKGDQIRLTLPNICVYRRIIEVYEKNSLEVRQDQIYINGSPADSYTFKMDYFFVLGDNRHHSRDSRHWGFLPEDHIIGKPVFIWFSANKNPSQPFRIYWNRIFNTPK